eukprot:3517656-Amphidinium_carterae.1
MSGMLHCEGVMMRSIYVGNSKALHKCQSSWILKALASSLSDLTQTLSQKRQCHSQLIIAVFVPP